METKNPFELLDEVTPTQQESLPALEKLDPEVKELLTQPQNAPLKTAAKKNSRKNKKGKAKTGIVTDKPAVDAKKDSAQTSEKVVTDPAPTKANSSTQESSKTEIRKNKRKGRQGKASEPAPADNKSEKTPVSKTKSETPLPKTVVTPPVEPEYYVPGTVPTPNQIKMFKKIINNIRSTYVAQVDEADVEWYKSVFGKVPNVAQGNIKGINAHARLATLRTMANMNQYTNVLLVNPEKTLRYGTVDFVYGTESRDNALVTYVNNELMKHKFVAQDVQCILAHFVGQPLVPDDLHRRINGSGARSKIGILMDVYALGVYKMHPINLSSMGYEIWTWCGHVFNGPFGGYESAIWCREGLDLSNVWYKADETANAYAVHDACDIMHKPGKASYEDTSVVWAVVDRVNTKYKGKFVPVYSIVVGERSDKPFLDQSYRSLDPIETVFLEVKDPIVKTRFDYVNNTITPWLASIGLYSKRKIALPMSMYADLKDMAMPRMHNQWTLGSVITAVNNYFTDHPWFSDLEKNLPAHFIHYRFDVATAIFSEFCEKKKDNLLIMNAVHGMDMHVANEQFKNVGVPIPPLISTKTLALVGLGLGVAGLAFAAYKGYVKPTTVLSIAKKTSVIAPAVIGFQWVPPRTNETFMQVAASNLVSFFTKGEYVPVHIPYVSNFVFDNVAGRIMACPSTWKRLVIGGIYTVFIGPLLEEAFKHVIPSIYVKWGLALLLANLDYAEPTSYVNFTVSFMKHYLFALLPLDTAIVLHALNNMTAFFIELRNAPFAQPMCIGSTPCFKALFTDKMCSGRTIVSNVNCTNLTEFKILLETDPVVILNNDLLVFNPKTESHVRPTNALPKFPAALDSNNEFTVKALEAFSKDDNMKVGAQGYYQLFAVSVGQYRPAITAYNSYLMILNRLLKAPPKHNIINKASLGIRFADPDEVYDSCDHLKYLFGLIKRDLPRENEVWYTGTQFFGEVYKNIKPIRRAINCENFEWFMTDEAFLFWLKHLAGTKRSMYRKYREFFKVRELTITSKCVTRIIISLKNDETLLKRRFIPRPVFRVDPEFASYVGPYIYAASELMKETFYFYPFFTDHWVVTLTFGSCMNSQALSSWFCQAKSSDYFFDKYPKLLLKEFRGFIHVIVAGDDVLILINDLRQTEIIIIEADVSACDHSTRYSMLEYEWAMLQLFGVPYNIIELLRENAHAKLRIYHPNDHREYVQIDRSYERNTGGVDTTVGNSLCVGSSWVSTMLRKCENDSNYDNEYYQQYLLDHYGFEMKIKRSFFGRDCHLSQTGTFLKGMWYHGVHSGCREDYWWGPLPSRLIKLSKVMTRPLCICRQNAKLSFPKHDHQATLSELWYCTMQMVKSMSYFVVIPPVRIWFSRLIDDYAIYAADNNLPPYREIKARTDDSSEIHKVQALQFDAGQIDMCPCWLDRVATHYAVETHVVLDWSERLQFVRPGTFSIHPFWQIMADIDYN